jgi:hypothetical protein
LIVTTDALPNQMNLSNLRVEATRSSETSVPKISTQNHILKYGILYSHRSENLKSYIVYILRKAQLNSLLSRQGSKVKVVLFQKLTLLNREEI